ncbi:MAG: chromosomal replication initiator protein DnaA [Flavobacteriaceae bacterium]|nr:chromosomal replication initiator protein DnaA [Flavobacteriaceae bacterium]
MNNRTAHTVWGQCLQFIKDNIGDKDAYKAWFEPIIPIKLDASTLTIQVPTEFFYEWIEEHYIKLLRVALNRSLGENARLVYNVCMESSKNKKPVTVPYPSAGKKAIPSQGMPVSIGTNDPEIKNPFVIPGIQKIKVDSQLNPLYNFENFIEGDSNRLAKNAGVAVSNKPGGTSFNPLLIYGGVGLGKTHLANAIGVEVKNKHPEKIVLYISSEKFVQQYTDSIRNNTRNDFIHFYQMIDVLIIDDVQFFSGKTGTQDVFFHIFNHLHQNRKQLILTSDKAPVEMQDIEHRLLSRFKWGLSAELQTPDYETRISILKNKLFRDGVEVPEEVINYIAKNIKTNIRELEGVVTSMIAHSAFDRKEFTIELAQQIVEKFVKNTKREISIDYIQKVVSSYFEIDIEKIQSTKRTRDIVQARHLTMYFAKRVTKNSLASIGKKIGNRNHATVLHACKAVENLMETDKQFLKYVKDLERQLV